MMLPNMFLVLTRVSTTRIMVVDACWSPAAGPGARAVSRPLIMLRSNGAALAVVRFGRVVGSWLLDTAVSGRIRKTRKTRC